jgi:hypothetical protein
MFKSLLALTLITMISALQSPPMPVDMWKMLKAAPKFDYGDVLRLKKQPKLKQLQASIAIRF